MVSPRRRSFGEAVGVDTGQRPHDGRLAVIDVARKRDDHVERVLSEAISSSSGSAHRMSSQSRPGLSARDDGYGQMPKLSGEFFDGASGTGDRDSAAWHILIGEGTAAELALRCLDADR